MDEGWNTIDAAACLCLNSMPNTLVRTYNLCTQSIIHLLDLNCLRSVCTLCIVFFEVCLHIMNAANYNQICSNLYRHNVGTVSIDIWDNN